MSVTSVNAKGELEISGTQNFSTQSTEFSGGQTIFVRISSNLPSRATSKLNLRDNFYNIVNSYDLNKEGNYFSAILPVPYDEGYFSLEAKLQDGGTDITRVKTIKIGNPADASLRVNINSSVDGSGENSSVLGEEDQDEDEVRNELELKADDETELYKNESTENTLDVEKKTFGQYMGSIFREIIGFIWPF